eukprot:9431500-Prorocentrum_lima.AAC.1
MQHQHFVMQHQPVQQQSLLQASWAPCAQHVPFQYPIRFPQHSPSFVPMFPQQGSHPAPTMSMGYDGGDRNGGNA